MQTNDTGRSDSLLTYKPAHDVVEGCTVCVRKSALAQYTIALKAKLTDRDGVVERIYIPLGGNKPIARVRWLKRRNRGREFHEVMDVRDLERILARDLERILAVG